jgi:type I restriction enzyme S subunit
LSELEIPESWAEAAFEQVLALNPRNSNLDDSLEVSFVPMNAVNQYSATIETQAIKLWKEVKKGFTHFRENDVLFAKITPCMENRKSAIAVALRNGVGAGSTEFHVFRTGGGISPQFLLAFLRQQAFVANAEKNMTGSAGQKRVPTAYLQKHLFPIPPAAEQHRIVSKIESTHSKIAAIEKAVTEAEALLKKYRESLLAKAFRGELVPQDPNDEPASKLLERIRAERAKAIKNGEIKKAKKDELPPISDDEIPFDIPKSWEWVRIGQAGEVQLGRQRAPQHHFGEYMRKYLRVANVFEEKIDVTDVYEMNFTPVEFEIFRLNIGDILLNEGQSIELVGRPAMFNGEMKDICFTNTLVRFVASKAVLPDYALTVFLGYFKNGRFRKIAKAGTNIAHLGADRFARLEFPLPPIVEQARIVSSLRASFSLLERTSERLLNLRSTNTKMREGLLRSAFSGRLVPQDPSEGTGHELLAQILKDKHSESATKETKKPKAARVSEK